MSETVTNWRVLDVVERGALHAALTQGMHQHAGGSLHVDEFHVVLDDRVYRYFLPCSMPEAVFGPEVEVEVSWDSPVTPDVSGALTQVQRSIHFDICREGDKFSDAIQRIEMDPAVKAELVNQIVAMQRLAMVLNTPGRALSPSKLNRF